MAQKDNQVLLEVKKLTKEFVLSGSYFSKTKKVKAVADISFDVKKNETFSLVGESGCGKSTTGRCVLRLIEPTSGEVLYHGQDITNVSKKEMRILRPKMQMIFQDPYSSLNPRMTIGSIIEETLKINKMGANSKERSDISMDILSKVGIRMDQYYRYPHEFSGGQKQRIGLARALVLNPEIIVCDEPVSALDVSIQSQVLNLLRNIQKEYQISYLFVSHNLSVVRYISDRIGVMYLGTMVEMADTNTIMSKAMHPYTKALLSAVPEANPHIKKERIPLIGDIPSPMNPPSGCLFHTRCPYVMEECKTCVPLEQEVEPGHMVRCHRCM